MRFASFVSTLSTAGVVLGADGSIIEVSEGWKQSAQTGGLKLKNHGLGLNYLKYCITSDPRSFKILKGLKQVLDREVGFFAALYPCETPDGQRWFLMSAFAAVSPENSTVVLHIDISELYNPAWHGVEAVTAVDFDLKHLFQDLRRTVIDAVGSMNEAPPNRDSGHADQKKLNKLTSRQRTILGHLAIGSSNAEIAAALQMSQATVKAQVAAALRKLGMANRTQAALFADKLGLGASASKRRLD